MGKLQNHRKTKDLFDNQVFINIVTWAVETITEQTEIADSNGRPADRLRASDKKQVISELLSILETEIEENDND